MTYDDLHHFVTICNIQNSFKVTITLHKHNLCFLKNN